MANKIIAGKGNNTLWGGEGKVNDTLIGGEGDDTFIYGKGNGKDVIQGADKNDLVVLSDITIDDLKSASNLFTGNDILLKFKDSGTLTVKNGKNSDVTFEIEGEQYCVNNGKLEYK